MYENNQNLSELLTCEVCKKYFSNPVLLPCENNVCEEHLKQKIKFNENEKNQEYQCELCQSKHEVPKNGFTLNKPFIQMINMNFHLDERTKTAKKVINNLVNLRKDIDLIVKDPEDFIYSYFSKEKNKIDLKRETLISKINDISDKMINKIKQIEKDCKSNLKKQQPHLIGPNKFDFNILTETWNEEIRNPQLNKNRLEKIIEDSNYFLKQIESQSNEAKKKILNKKCCYFLPNKEEIKRDLFGELIIDDYKIIINNQCEKHDSSPIKLDSSIVNSDQSNKLINLCEFENKKDFKLIYRASRDGFSAFQFHSKCDNIPKTLTIIKVKDQPHIFGGYTEATWEGDWEGKTYKEDPNAFIFSLVNSDNKPIKMKIGQNIQNAISCYPSLGPTFGGGSDFYISSDSNTNTFSSSNLGHTYQHQNYQKDSNEAKSFLAGSKYFLTSEIEIYQVL